MPISIIVLIVAKIAGADCWKIIWSAGYLTILHKLRARTLSAEERATRKPLLSIRFIVYTFTSVKKHFH